MKRTGMIGLAVSLIVGLVVGLSGCTDVNTPNVQPTDYRSNVIFVNLAHVGTGVAISYDTTHSIGSVNYGQKSTYQNLPAGSRYFIFNYGAVRDTIIKGLAADHQYSFFSVYEPANGDTVRTYSVLQQSYTWATAGVKDSALVRFVNLSSDTVSDFADGLDFTLGPDSLGLSITGLGFDQASDYMQIRAGNSSYMVVVDATGDTLVPSTALSSLASYGRYSVIIYGNHTNVQKLVLQEH